MEIHIILFMVFPFLKSPSNYINDQWSRKPQSNCAPKVVDLENSQKICQWFDHQMILIIYLCWPGGYWSDFEKNEKKKCLKS